jgi:hypothetical protein
MFSKPLALGLLVVTCIVAAGGGAYIATLQKTQSNSVATLPAVRPSEPAPQHLGGTGSAATTSQPSQPAVAAPMPVPTSASPAASADPTGQAAPRLRPTAKAADKLQAKANPAPEKAQSSQFMILPPPPRAAELPTPAQVAPALPTPASQGVDPNPQTQRPWPGPPVSQPLLFSGFAPDPARIEDEPASHDGVKLWEEVVVPTESVIGLLLESSLSTEYARVEDRVDARVTRDVRVGGRVAIPAGTHAVGSVTMVEKGGRVKERARIGIRFNTLVFADASRVSINTDTVYREGESPANQASARIGGAAIGGAIIGAILGGGKGAAIGSSIGAASGAAAAMSGDRYPVVLTAGTTLSVRTQTPISLTVEK